MANMHLVTGYAGEEHIESNDERSRLASYYGKGEYVMDRGNKFAASIISNNKVKILDGDILMQGGHIRKDTGTYNEMDIENGTAGYMRNDLIGVTYEKDSVTGVEVSNMIVIKGDNYTGTQGDPDNDPAYTTGDIVDGGAIYNFMPLYRVELDGLVLMKVTKLFKTVNTFADTLEEFETEFNDFMSESQDDVDEALAQLDIREEARFEDVWNDLDCVYGGKDLTVKFAEEVALFSDAWAWIQDRLDNDNLSGIHVGDYIPATVNGETHQMQIAGIDTYYRTGDSEVGHHIDWISRDCYSATVKFNTTNNNNGNASEQSPFKASNLYTWLNSTLYNLLPAELRAVIKNKRILAPLRYSSGGSITDDSSWAWEDWGPLWVPLESEIFDGITWSTKGFGNGQGVTYPLFRSSYKNRIKGAGPGGARAHWWTASALSGNATYVVFVTAHGDSNYDNASDALYVPVCFRMIKA